MCYNCCFDKYFEVRDFICVNVIFVNVIDDIVRNQKMFFFMVKFCFDLVDVYLKEKCEIDYLVVDKLKYLLVIG